MSGDNRYYYKRACEERARADSTVDMSAARVHHALADLYERRLVDEDLEIIRIEPSGGSDFRL